MLSIPAALQASYEAYLRAGEIPETVHRELRGHHTYYGPISL